MSLQTMMTHTAKSAPVSIASRLGKPIGNDRSGSRLRGVRQFGKVGKKKVTLSDRKEKNDKSVDELDQELDVYMQERAQQKMQM